MKYIAVVVVLLMMGLAGVGAIIAQNRYEEANVVSTAEASVNPKPSVQGVLEQKNEPKPMKVSVDMTFWGDVFWGRRMQTWSETSELRALYPFVGLETFEKQPNTNWIANLECPVTDQTVSQYEQENLLKFNCQPGYLPEAKKYFDIFSLANNHTDNVNGQQGLGKTREFLSQNQIQYFGHFDNVNTSDICEVIDMKAVIHFDDSSRKNGSIPVALCGYHNVYKLPTEAEIAVITEFAEYLPTFVMPHQGAEYIEFADNLQTSTYRAMIEGGADAVIGGHTHSVINTEVYQDKLIAYSIGNFIFDQQFSQQVTTGLGITANMEFLYNEVAEMISMNCAQFQDDCLAMMQKMNIQKPQMTIKYDALVSDSSNKQTKKASSELEQQALNQANWGETKQVLNK